MAGGSPPAPWQCSCPPQSPVSHWPLPLESKLQPCLPHILPDHLSGTSMTTSCPLPRKNPPSLSVFCPAPPRIPGHMVSLQLLTMMICSPSAQKEVKEEHYKLKFVDSRRDKERSVLMKPIEEQRRMQSRSETAAMTRNLERSCRTHKDTYNWVQSPFLCHFHFQIKGNILFFLMGLSFSSFTNMPNFRVMILILLGITTLS